MTSGDLFGIRFWLIMSLWENIIDVAAHRHKDSPMKISDVKTHFGNMSKACKAIGLVRSAPLKWKEDTVPAKHAISFFLVSDGQLDLGLDDYRAGLTKPRKAD